VVGLSSLKNIRSLNVSCSEFDSHGLDIVCDDLPHIEALDLSQTEVTELTPLLKCKDNLRVLKLFKLKVGFHVLLGLYFFSKNSSTGLSTLQNQTQHKKEPIYFNLR